MTGLEVLAFFRSQEFYDDIGQKYGCINELCDVIEKELNVQKEPKHYLKWEDLEFKEEEQWLKVKMGDRNYTLIYHKWFMLGKWYYSAELRNEETLDIINHIREKIFNDLHLERVEE